MQWMKQVILLCTLPLVTHLHATHLHAIRQIAIHRPAIPASKCADIHILQAANIIPQKGWKEKEGWKKNINMKGCHAKLLSAIKICFNLSGCITNELVIHKGY